MEYVAHGRIKSCAVFCRLLIADTHIRYDSAQKTHALAELSTLRLLLQRAGVLDTDGQCTHIVHIFPGTAHHSPHSSAESSKDSLFNLSHNDKIF